jgi:AraC-like DNA-binding protein
MNIEFSSTNPVDFFHVFAEELRAVIDKNTFTIPSHLGSGSGILLKIEDELFFNIYDFQLNTSITAHRKAVSYGEYFPIICWFSPDQMKQETHGEKKIINRDSPYSIFFPSPKIESNYLIPAKNRIIILTITLTKNWLLRNLSGNKKSNILNLIESNNPFFLYEEISFNMGKYLEKLKGLEMDNIVSSIQLRSYILNFLVLFISAIEKRKRPSLTSNINHLDVEKLFDIRQVLTEQYSTPPAIKALASQAAMSESKLQKLFREVFGITIYQYVLKVRIEEAKKMIESKRFSVSEVGYEIGYTNLSHFTAAFKKQVGINPKQYLLSLQ